MILNARLAIVTLLNMSILQTLSEDKALLAATICFGVIGALFTAAKTYSLVRLLLDLLVLPGINVRFYMIAGACMSSTTNLLTLDVYSFLSLVQERVLGQVSYQKLIAEMLHVDTIY